MLQKRIVRIITFSKFDEHSSPLFQKLKIPKFVDLVFLHNALFMHDYHCNNLSPSFKASLVKSHLCLITIQEQLRGTLFILIK